MHIDWTAIWSFLFSFTIPTAPPPPRMQPMCYRKDFKELNVTSCTAGPYGCFEIERYST